MKVDFELIKDLDEKVGVKEHKWYGSENQTEENLMHDPGQGEGIVIRHWEYQRDPSKEKPTKDQILTPEYIKQLQMLLWADSLKLVMEPRVEVTEDKILIFAPCQARAGATFSEEPKYLQEWIK